METKILFVIIGCAVAASILILAYLIHFIAYQQRIRNLYKGAHRDERFAGRLLTLIFGDKVIKKPYVLRDDGANSPKADAIFVCSGGVAIISVQKGSGLYSAPEKGSWRVIENGEMRIIDNLLEKQQVYISEIAATLMKHSLSCPAVRGYVFLTDDGAEADYMSSDHVLTGSGLIEELKDFDTRKRLRSKNQKEILEAIRRNDANIRQTLAYRSQRGAAIADAGDGNPEDRKEKTLDPIEEFDLSDLMPTERNTDAISIDESPTATRIPVILVDEDSNGDDRE